MEYHRSFFSINFSLFTIHSSLSQENTMPHLYHIDQSKTSFSSTVVSCHPLEGEKNTFSVELQDTAFYPMGGGQPCDLGTLNGCKVVDVQLLDSGKVVHTVQADEPLSGVVQGQIDPLRRLDHTHQHSAQHLISHFFVEKFNAHSLGLHIGAQDSYVDIYSSPLWQINDEICLEIEEQVNQWIRLNLPCKCFFPTPAELEQLPLRKKPPAHDELRIVMFGQEEAVACCGTHVNATGDLGAVFITGHAMSHGNVRIYFVAGQRAYAHAREALTQANKSANLFSCKVSSLFDATQKLKQENSELSRKCASLAKTATAQAIQSLKPIILGQASVYICELENATPQQLKEGLSLLCKEPKAIALLCTKAQSGYSLALGVGANSTLDAGKALRHLLSLFGGKGGGRSDSAFGKADNIDLEQCKAELTKLIAQ